MCPPSGRFTLHEGDKKQWIHQNEIISWEDMTRRIEQNYLKYYVREGVGFMPQEFDLAITHNQTGIVHPMSFVKKVHDQRIMQLNESFPRGRDNWSLMEEAAIRRSFRFLSVDDESCIMWREGESWMGICRRFERELEVLLKEDEKMNEQYVCNYDWDEWASKASEISQLAESSVVESTSEDFLHRIKHVIPSQKAHYLENLLEKYQVEGIRKLIGLYESGFTGTFLVDQGQGQRVQVIMFLAFLDSMRVWGPYMVIAPRSMVPNWVRDFEQWLPSLKIVSLNGTAEERKEMYSGPSAHREQLVVIVPYDVAITDQQQLNEIVQLYYLVIDEGHAFKDHRCTLISSLKCIRCCFRLFLPEAGSINFNCQELSSLLEHTQLSPMMSVRESENKYATLLVHSADEEKAKGLMTGVLKSFIVTNEENLEAEVRRS